MDNTLDCCYKCIHAYIPCLFIKSVNIAASVIYQMPNGSFNFWKCCVSSSDLDEIRFFQMTKKGKSKGIKSKGKLCQENTLIYCYQRNFLAYSKDHCVKQLV